MNKGSTPYEIIGDEQTYTRIDVEAVLQKLEQEDQNARENLVRVKLSSDQQMVELLIEKIARQMLAPLLRRIKELEADQLKWRETVSIKYSFLFHENKALKAKLAAAHYELAHKEIESDRLLELLDTDFSSEYQDLFYVLVKASEVAEYSATGKTVTKPRLRELIRSIEKFKEAYPHLSREQLYREATSRASWLD